METITHSIRLTQTPLLLDCCFSCISFHTKPTNCFHNSSVPQCIVRSQDSTDRAVVKTFSTLSKTANQQEENSNHRGDETCPSNKGYFHTAPASDTKLCMIHCHSTPTTLLLPWSDSTSTSTKLTRTHPSWRWRSADATDRIKSMFLPVPGRPMMICLRGAGWGDSAGRMSGSRAVGVG